MRAMRWGRRLVAVAIGAVLLGGTGEVAHARVGDASRPGVGDVKVTTAPQRVPVRERYRYVPPPPPPVTPPKPTYDVPAICLQQRSIVCISKREQKLRLFESGALYMETPVKTGRPGYESPSGLWTVRIKDANAWSYEFNAPLPYSLEYDLQRGIYIHYSSTFAQVGPSYIGSHGCINVGNLEHAKMLFNRTPVGASVYVY